jgi:hypothetical protein
LNAFESIKAIFAATIEEKPLEAYIWEQSDIPSLWNIDWTDAANEGGRVAEIPNQEIALQLRSDAMAMEFSF